MSTEPRYVPELDEELTQDQQAALIHRTDNGPSLSEEEEARLLAEEYGEPDEHGLYTQRQGDAL